MPGVSSILGRDSHLQSLSDLFTVRSASHILATLNCHPHHDYDLHPEHPAMPNTLHPYDIHISRMTVNLLYSHFLRSSPLVSRVVILTFPYDSRCL